MARKKLNKSLVVLLSGIGFLLLIVVSTAVIMSLKPQDPSQFLQLARTAEAEKDWGKAAGFFSRAYNVSKDATHLAEAGRMLREQGDLAAARAYWERAKTESPSLIEPRQMSLDLKLEVAKLAGGFRNWRSVLEEADGLLSIDDAFAVAHYARGLALYEMRAEDPAFESQGLESLREAVAGQPLNVDFNYALARYNELIGNPAEATRIMDALISQLEERTPASITARIRYAEQLTQRREFDEVERLHREILDNAPDPSRPEANLAVGRYYAARFRQARLKGPMNDQMREWHRQGAALLEKALESEDTELEAMVELTRLDQGAGLFEAARDRAQERLKGTISRVGLQQYREKVHIYELALIACEASLQLARQAGEDATGRDAHLARAMEFVEKAKSELSEEPRGYLQQGQVYLAMGKQREAIEAVTSADLKYRQRGVTSWATRIFLARLHMAVNEPGTANRILGELVAAATESRPDHAPFWSTYAEAQLATQNFEGALDAAERVLSARADDEEMLKVKITALNRLGRTDEAEAVAARVDESGVTALIVKARSLVDADKEGEALDLLTDHLEQDPANTTVLRNLIILLSSLDRTAEAQSWVDRAQQAKPDDPVITAMAVSVDPGLSEDARRDKLIALIDVDPNPLSRAVKRLRYFMGNRLYDRIDGAAQEVETILASSTDVAEVSRRQIMRFSVRGAMIAAIERSDWEAARAAVKRAQDSNLDGADGKVFLGEFQFFRDEFDAAAVTLKDSLSTQPTNAYVLTLLGACSEKRGQLRDALAYFQKAVDANPNFGQAWRGLAVIADALGESATYAEALGQCSRLLPNDAWVQKQELRAEEERNPAEAIKRRMAALTENPNDLDNLKQLAKLSQRVGNVQDADTYFEKAIALQSDDWRLIFEAAQHYRDTRRNPRALEIIQKYIDSRVDPAERADAMITLAGHHMRNGDREASRNTLIEAAAISETFSVCLSLADYYLFHADDPTEAARWYDKAIALGEDGESPRLSTAMIRRIVCTLHARINDVDAAERVLAAYRQRFPEWPEALYWGAQISSHRGDLTKAIADLDAYIEQRPNDAQGVYRRAQCYVAQGRWADAIRDLERLASRDPLALDLKPRMLLARSYERAGSPDKAFRELQRLYADAPSSSRAALELVSAHVRAGQLSDAERIATAQVNGRTGEGKAEWLILRAEIANQLRDAERALADYRAASELMNHPPSTIAQVLASLLAMGRNTEGISFYQQNASQRQQPSVVDSYYAQLLAGAGRSDDAVASFARALDKALGESFASILRIGRTAVRTVPPEQLVSASQSLAGGSVIASVVEACVAEKDGDCSTALARIGKAASDASGPRKLNVVVAHAVLATVCDDPSAARTAYEQAIGIAPDDAVSRNNLANLLLSEFNETERAAEHARKAVANAGADRIRAQTRDTLGWIYVRMGQYDDAIAELGQAINLDSAEPEFYLHLGEAYRRNAQYKEATHILEGGLRLARGVGRADYVQRIEASLSKARQGDNSVDAEG